MTEQMFERNEAWDRGYAKGYSEGYTNSVNDLIGWLLDEKYPDAAEALRYALSSEGVAEQNERIRALYGSLRKLAAEAREPDHADLDKRS